MITLKTLILIYKKTRDIDTMSSQNMAMEVYFPAIIKIYLNKELKGKRSNIDYIHPGDSDSVNERYTELYKIYRKSDNQDGFGKFL